MAANVDVAALSIKELKAHIQRSGLSSADCFEKSDLRARAVEASARLALAAGGGASTSGGAGKMGPWDVAVVAKNGATASNAELVVVLLHGLNAPPGDLVPLATPLGQLEPRRTVYVFPSRGSEWWRLDPTEWAAAALSERPDPFAHLVRAEPPGLAACRAAGLDFVAALRERYPRGTLVLGGFSQGAMTATDLALSLPNAAPAAGILHLSGAPIVVDRWASQLVDRTTKVGALKAFVAHGRADPTLPFVVSNWTRELLASAGCDVTYVPHAGGHAVGDEGTLRAIAAWLAAIRPIPGPGRA
jgi:predicted esterase